MPALSLPMSQAARCPVGFVPNQRRADSICYLTNEQQHTGGAALEAEHGVEVYQEISEPHRGAQVVQEMSRCVTYPSADRQGPLGRQWHRLLHDEFDSCDKTSFIHKYRSVLVIFTNTQCN